MQFWPFFFSSIALIWICFILISHHHISRVEKSDLLETSAEHDATDWQKSKTSSTSISTPTRTILEPVYNPKKTNASIEYRLAFMHIGKAGGTSLRMTLTRAVRRANNKKLNCNPCSYHYDFSRIEGELVKKKQTSTMLPVSMIRNPIERSISHFYFAKRLSWTAGLRIRNQNMSDYLRDPETMLETRGVWQDGQNAVTWFSGTHIGNWVKQGGPTRNNVELRERISMNRTTLLRTAVANFHKFFWVGLLEHSKESLQLLEYQADLLPLEMKQSNKGSKKEPVDVQTREKLAMLMPMDIWFYEYARKIILQRIEFMKQNRNDRSKMLTFDVNNFDIPNFDAIPSETELGGCNSTRFTIDCPKGLGLIEHFKWDIEHK